MAGTPAKGKGGEKLSIKHDNRVPPIRSDVELTDGRSGKVVCGWYAKGKGGWRIQIELADGKAIFVGLRQLRDRRSA